ncbi:Flp pilus assembly complex ATPase component TadA [Achromobacter sp. Marseille-Q0513]|uniref:ATPase, T2SS/T4P/T4SS family n=1 Tax=Achromobacter sp. Marseille-Q0513 TaxID=2829161 RepID=UPI001B9AA694|nr:ATPase, T2SS/T4P/T4SS family [Achromobacter sp. Marseille-Q0513]MBR8657110.1 Flp pilus assembly complex ATPase component TadA [Achromobacter sp. Marseille-Q0513]
MLDIELSFPDAEPRRMSLPSPVLVGRAPHCGLRIAHWRVARRHAWLRAVETGVLLEDLDSLSGTLLNGARVERLVAVLPEDDIFIGPCRLRVSRGVVPDARVPAATPAGPRSGAAPLPRETDILPEPAFASRLAHRRRLHAALLEALDLRRRDLAGASDSALRAEAGRLLTQIVADDQDMPAGVDHAALCQEVLDEAVGLGPLEPLLAAADVTEIMVNRHDEIYVERQGRLYRHPAAFSSEQSVRWAIDRVVTPLGRRIDEAAPMVDARLPDGSRRHAIIPPAAIRGASLTIRKFPGCSLTLDALTRGGSLSAAMAAFLAFSVRARRNLIVSGGTGSGKTTLLNVLSNEIPEAERVITIEDAAELRLEHAHRVALEARPPNPEGKGRIDIRELVRNALRMRPDRIVVGECRGGEAFDMLTAMNTGHEGPLPALQATSPREARARREARVLLAGLDLPLAAVREHIAASVDLILQSARLADGRRLVTAIVELTGIESGRIQLQELFRFDRRHGFVACGVFPAFARAGNEIGELCDPAWFQAPPSQAFDGARHPGGDMSERP